MVTTREKQRQTLLALLHTLRSPRLLNPTLPRYIVHYPTLPYTLLHTLHSPRLLNPTLPRYSVHRPTLPLSTRSPAYTTLPWAGYSTQHCPALPLATLPRSTVAFLTRPVPVCCRPPQLATSQQSSGKRTGSSQTCWRIRTSRPTSSAVCGPSATFSSPPRPMGLSSDPGFPPWSP